MAKQTTKPRRWAQIQYGKNAAPRPVDMRFEAFIRSASIIVGTGSYYAMKMAWNACKDAYGIKE